MAQAKLTWITKVYISDAKVHLIIIQHLVAVLIL